jgi:hypothetical protein
MVLSVAVLLIGAGPARAQDAKPPEETDLNVLSMEVNALQLLSTFNLTPEQLRKLQAWAKETMEKPRKRDTAKASKEYREKLEELRTALVEAIDEDRIDQLSDELEDLRKSEKPTLDDGFDLSNAARSRASQALGLLKVHQVATYLAAVADDLFDPVDRLIDSLQSLRGLEGNAWKQRRQEIVEDIVRLAAGVDEKKGTKLGDQVEALLTRAHGMKLADFKKKRQELDNAACKLLGNVSTMDVLRNEVEYALAELLSNPRLGAALEIRLKNSK